MHKERDSSGRIKPSHGVITKRDRKTVSLVQLQSMPQESHGVITKRQDNCVAGSIPINATRIS